MKTSFLVRLILVTLLASIPLTLQAQRKKQVAVLEFAFDTADQGIVRYAYGNHQNLSKQMANAIENHLVQQGNYIVVERGRIDKLLYEQNLGNTGRLDASTAARLGKLLGADELIYGSITMLDMEGMPQDRYGRDPSWNPNHLGAKIGVNFRMVDTTTGQLKVAREVVGVSRKAEAGGQKSAKRKFFEDLAKDMLTPQNSRNNTPKLKEEDVRNTIRLAVNDAILNIAKLMEERPAETAQNQPATVTGRVLAVNGPSVVIAGINKAFVRQGDRLFVRRVRVMKDATTGKDVRYTEKVGEVEIVEIQEEVVIGSFSGAAAAQAGDLITNTSNVAASDLNNARSVRNESRSVAPTNSNGLRTYGTGHPFRVQVPETWREYPAQGVVTFAPPGALVQGNAFTLGAMIGQMPTQGRTLQIATDQFVARVRQNNPYLRVQAGARSVLLQNRPALSQTLSGLSPATRQNETVTLYTTLLPGNQLFYVLTVVPAPEAARYAPTFAQMLRTLVIGQ
jgi:curli biogenesis system outer membrane secretion channel CsgG